LHTVVASLFLRNFRQPPKPPNVTDAARDVATLQFDLTDADTTVQLRAGISSVSTANAHNIYRGTWLPLGKIKDGGKLGYILSKTPTEWGAAPELTPPSGPNADCSQPTATPLAPPVQVAQ
jgi:putative alpha-1,2-mannosidase